MSGLFSQSLKGRKKENSVWLVGKTRVWVGLSLQESPYTFTEEEPAHVLWKGGGIVLRARRSTRKRRICRGLPLLFFPLSSVFSAARVNLCTRVSVEILCLSLPVFTTNGTAAMKGDKRPYFIQCTYTTDVPVSSKQTSRLLSITVSKACLARVCLRC